MARWDKEDAVFRRVNKESIPCKDCKYAKMDGKFAPTKGSCEMYEVKPMDVLLRGADCKKYKRK